MNTYAVCTVLAVLATPALCIFDGGVALTGVGSLGASTLSGGGLALTTGTSTAFLTSAGVAAAGLGLLGAAVIGGAIASRAFRAKRDVSSLAALQVRRERSMLLACMYCKLQSSLDATKFKVVDNYFMTILDVDVDDCGKKLVCEIMALEKDARSVEENLIANLFTASTTIDPLSAKAEYDLAAFVGANYDKAVCARRYAHCVTSPYGCPVTPIMCCRYHRCEYDRKTIMQALAKLENAQEAEEQDQQ